MSRMRGRRNPVFEVGHRARVRRPGAWTGRGHAKSESGRALWQPRQNRIVLDLCVCDCMVRSVPQYKRMDTVFFGIYACAIWQCVCQVYSCVFGHVLGGVLFLGHGVSVLC